MSRYLASDIDQSTRAKDELKDDELGQISGGDGVVNHSEFSFVKLLDVSTPKIRDRDGYRQSGVHALRRATSETMSLPGAKGRTHRKWQPPSGLRCPACTH
jgi:hypothetical protein